MSAKYSNTIRRNWLKKQIELGKVDAMCNYHLTDDYRFDASNNNGETGWMKARIAHPIYTEYINYVGNREYHCNQDRIEGMMNFREDDFTTQSGAAWKTEKGLITLKVHSNLSYTLRINS
jgi:hypothetical protein